RDVISDLEVRVEKTAAKIDVDSLPTIEADPLQMRQLFQNLLGNALKFVKPGASPLIRISGLVTTTTGALGVQAISGNGGRRPAAGSASAPNNEVLELVVEDNGIGFEQKYADRIFAPFQRLTGIEDYEGTGIGLAICQKIVQRHGGSIRAESRPGSGSRFIVRLPVTHSRDRP
ncbi:MAG: sensor histidine kinase, partial [Blastocatellia bacterium]